MNREYGNCVTTRAEIESFDCTFERTVYIQIRPTHQSFTFCNCLKGTAYAQSGNQILVQILRFFIFSYFLVLVTQFIDFASVSTRPKFGTRILVTRKKNRVFLSDLRQNSSTEVLANEYFCNIYIPHSRTYVCNGSLAIVHISAFF